MGAKVRAAVTGRTHIPPALPLPPARPGDPCDLHRPGTPATHEQANSTYSWGGDEAIAGFREHQWRVRL